VGFLICPKLSFFFCFGILLLNGTKLLSFTSNSDKLQAESTEDFSPKRPDRVWRSPSVVLNEYLGSFPGVMRPWGEFQHQLPTCAEVANADGRAV